MIRSWRSDSKEIEKGFDPREGAIQKIENKKKIRSLRMIERKKKNILNKKNMKRRIRSRNRSKEEEENMIRPGGLIEEKEAKKDTFERTIERKRDK